MDRNLTLFSTNSSITDKVLSVLVNLFELAFPERVASYYIGGSYADNSQVGSSDVDLTIIFKGEFESQNERNKAEHLSDYCAMLSAVELDVSVVDEASLQTAGLRPNLMLGGRLVHGKEIRPKYKLISIAEWTRDRMHSSYWRTAKLFNRASPLTLPLEYPAPESEFFGYNQRKLKLPSGQEVNCTRDLIRLVSWSATALIAYQCGQYVTSKSECIRLYREAIGDEWSNLLEDIYQNCRVKWNYLIPNTFEERQQLRQICQRTLAFENHFLKIYKQFVLEQLSSNDDEHKQWIQQLLTDIPFQDEEIQTALQTL